MAGGETWTAYDDLRLRLFTLKGLHADAIAGELGRTVDAVYSRQRELKRQDRWTNHLRKVSPAYRRQTA